MATRSYDSLEKKDENNLCSKEKDEKEEKDSAYKKMEDECKIYLISSEEECEKTMNELKFGDIVGLDCEWKAYGAKGKIALIQLATTKDILLIHLHSIGFIPSSLQKILTDPSIIKVGAAINQDKKKLKKDYGVDIVSARNIDPGQNGLAKIVYAYLQVKLPKEKRVQCSNWEIWPLTKEQIFYAAADAYYSLLVGNGSSSLIFPESLPFSITDKETAKSVAKSVTKKSNINNRKVFSDPSKKVKLYSIRVYSFDGRYTYTSPDRTVQLLKEGRIVISDPNMVHPVCLPEFIGDDGKRADCYYHLGDQNSAYPTIQIEACCTVCGQKENVYRWAIVGSVHHKMLTGPFGKDINGKLLLNSSFNRLLVCGLCFRSCQSYMCTYLKSVQQSFCDQKVVDHLTEIVLIANKFHTAKKQKQKIEPDIKDYTVIADFLEKNSDSKKSASELTIEDTENARKIAKGMLKKYANKSLVDVENYFITLAKENPGKFVSLWRNLFLEQMQPKYLPLKLLDLWKSVE